MEVDVRTDNTCGQRGLGQYQLWFGFLKKAAYIWMKFVSSKFHYCGTVDLQKAVEYGIWYEFNFFEFKAVMFLELSLVLVVGQFHNRLSVQHWCEM